MFSASKGNESDISKKILLRKEMYSKKEYLMKNKMVVLIPAYEPDNKLIHLVDELIELQFRNIIIVNDGSSKKCDQIFEQLGKHESVNVVKHTVNQGKGRALKTGFNTILNQYQDCIGCITVDSDGQHLPVDIEACSVALMKNINKLILGVRNFNDSNIPLRSRFGNKMTKGVVSILGGIHIDDTQTGLRAISTENMRKFMSTIGEKYEYEMNMLMDAKEQNIDFLQIPISTVYINDNESSHFNPITDSLKIYKVFLKYIFSSLSSSVLDITLFAILVYFLNGVFESSYILISTIIARIVSIVFNYKINFSKVFNGENLKKGSFNRYILLAIAQMLISAFLVNTISSSISSNETITKILVDIGLFFISFVIQREFVFTKENTQI